MPDSNPFSVVFRIQFGYHLSKYLSKYIRKHLLPQLRSCSSEPDRFKPPSKCCTSKNIRQRTGPYILIIAETCRRSVLSQYNEEVLSMKEANGVAKTRELKYRKSVEPAPPPNAGDADETRPRPPPPKRGVGQLQQPRTPPPPALPKQAERRAGKGRK